MALINEFIDGDILSAEALNMMENIIESDVDGYTPTDWTAGDVVTAEKINHLADGFTEFAQVCRDDSYVPIAWTTGEVVTAEKLNAMMDIIIVPR